MLTRCVGAGLPFFVPARRVLNKDVRHGRSQTHTFKCIDRPRRKDLDVGHTKLKDLIRDGQLKAVVAGRRIRILVDSIAAYHASLPK